MPMNLVNFNKEYLGLPEITKPVTIDLVSGEGIRGGLYDPIIFGDRNNKKYKTQFASIYLNANLISPVLLTMLKTTSRIIYRICTEDLRYNIDLTTGKITEDKEGKFRGVFDIIRMLKDGRIKLHSKSNDIKTAVLENLQETTAIFINRILVIPPFLRPINFADGRYSPDEINDHYIEIISSSRRLKGIRITPSNYEKYSAILSHIQKNIMNLYKFITSKIGGKRGNIRQNLISKTTDFSGRAVITGDPELEIDQMLIPFAMALRLFKPFILHHAYQNVKEFEPIIRLVYMNSSDASKILIDRLITDVAFFRVKDLRAINILKKYTEMAMKGKLILAKRDPALHRDSMRSFKVGLTMDKTIHIAQPVCKGFNADFDGDTMAVFLPLTKEGQQDAEKLLYTKNPYSAKKLGAVGLEVGAELSLGVFLLTKTP